MDEKDEILRAFALISALKKNIPQNFELEERWVREYHEAVVKIEQSTKKDLSDFKVSNSDLKKSIASSNYVTGEATYLDGLWCERSILLQKIDAILTYFTGLHAPEGNRIGF